MKKVAVLYIALGRYVSFWKGFYESCEKCLGPCEADLNQPHTCHTAMGSTMSVAHLTAGCGGCVDKVNGKFQTISLYAMS